jgi:hypothetical protein
MVKVFNFPQLTKITKISLTTAITVGAMSIQAVNAAPFKFSDFTFKRAATNPTTFHTTVYPNGKTGVAAFEQFVQGESIAISPSLLNARKLDPNKLKLIQDYAVKLYFIDEGAGYRNQLRLDTIHSTNSTANAKDGMIFYDGSVGTGTQELRKGDYVELGTIPYGSTLDFQLRANGFNTSQPNNSDPNANVWYADITKNIDGIQHVMAFEYAGYLVLAFEDLQGGGDKDYNDIVFAIDIGAANLAQIPTAPQNLAPIAVNDTANTPYGTAVTVNVLSNDSDPENQPLTLSSLNSVSTPNGATSVTTNNGGTAAISSGKVLYTPKSGFFGTDSFTYTIKDIYQVTNTATVNVTVAPPPNQPPVTSSDTATTPFKTAVTIDVLSNDNDPEGQALTLTQVTNPAPTSGTVSINNNKVVYTPNSGFSGTDGLVYTVKDAQGATSTGNVTVTVTPNGAPKAVNDKPTTPKDTAVTIDVLANDSDPENQALTLTNVDAPGDGTVSISNNKVLYTPNSGFSGVDNFEYTMTDTEGATNSATVNVTVGSSSSTPNGPSCSTNNNGHGNNAPVTYDLGSGVKITISQYDPSNPSGQQKSSLITALSQGVVGKAGNGSGANTSTITLVSGASYSMTLQQATDLVNNYPDWEDYDSATNTVCSNNKRITPMTPFNPPD